jgi:3-polyprenyl-4-hydroxybenzoate decarboxylase
VPRVGALADPRAWARLGIAWFEWPLATRMRVERDLLVVPDVRADRAAPLERAGLVGKLGIDATRKGGIARTGQRRCRPRRCSPACGG